MNNIIKITSNSQNGKQTVNARELHEFLESKQDFSTWIKNRISDYNFIEGEDFATLHKIVERAKRKEYHISLNMAKELSMVERNDKGKQARKYFIECEESMKEIQLTIPSTFSEALMLASKQASEIEQLKPDAEYGRKIRVSSTLYTATNIAPLVGMRSAIMFNLVLKDFNIIKSGTGNTDYALCARYENNGLVVYEEVPYLNKRGETCSRRNLKWTRRGLDWLIMHKDLLHDCNRKSLPLPKQNVALVS